jgi:hypothetical protein
MPSLEISFKSSFPNPVWWLKSQLLRRLGLNPGVGSKSGNKQCPIVKVLYHWFESFKYQVFFSNAEILFYKKLLILLKNKEVILTLLSKPLHLNWARELLKDKQKKLSPIKKVHSVGVQNEHTMFNQEIRTENMKLYNSAGCKECRKERGHSRHRA